MKIDDLVERIPALDGGFRRRLISGVIVLLTLTFLYVPVFEMTASAFFIAILKNPIITFLILIIVYAVGILVEMIGKLFVVKAVGAFFYTLSFPYRHYIDREMPEAVKYLIIVIATIPMIYAAFLALIVGLFIPSSYKINLSKKNLSEKGLATFESFPEKIKTGLRYPLRENFELAWDYIEDQMDGINRHRIKAKLIRRKEVLVLISAIVFSLLIFIPQSFQQYTISPYQEIERSKTEIQYIERRMNDIDADKNRLQKKLNDLEKYEVITIQKKDKHETDVTTSKKDIDNLAKKLKPMNDKIDLINSLDKQYGAEISLVEKAINKALADIESSQVSKKNIESELNILEQRKQNVSLKLNSLSLELKDLLENTNSDSIENFETLMSNYETGIQKLTDELNNINEEIKVYVGKLNQISKQIVENEYQIELRKSDLEIIKHKKESNNKERLEIDKMVKHIQSEMSFEESKIENYLFELDVQKKEAEKIEMQIEDINVRIYRLSSIQEEDKNKKRSLIDNINRLEKYISDKSIPPPTIGDDFANFLLYQIIAIAIILVFLGYFTLLKSSINYAIELLALQDKNEIGELTLEKTS